MARLFKRACKVTIYRTAEPGSFIASNPQFFVQQPNAIEVSELRVQFKIEKSLESSPNACEVTITNANPATRAFLEKKPLVVRLDAGYDDNSRHVFTGDLRYGQSQLDGTDWNTTLQLGDGDRAYRNARVSRSYRKGTSVITALKEVATSLGLQLSGDVAASPDLQVQFASGHSLQGPARDELTRLLAPFGYHWSIETGRLQILKDQAVAPGTAFLISQDTGMIGSPDYATPERNGKPPQLKVKTLLYPELFAGAPINVNSRDVEGVFRINKLIHSGDTHDSDWTTEIEAIPTGQQRIVA